MSYITENEKIELDDSSTNLVNHITNTNNPDDFSNYIGRINYSFSRIIGQLIGSPSYKKIAMATGVLENIKQELYRRSASLYEDFKMMTFQSTNA